MPLMSPTLPKEIDEILPKELPEIIPVNRERKTIEQNENALQVLKAAGVDQRRGKSRMAPLLTEYGLGLDEIARKLSTFATHSDDERIQYDACKMALQLHGELDKDGDKNSPVQINFVGVTPDLLQVLIPRS